ncbi:hypothetical protein GCM10010177_13250 [Actinomadura citrea]|nr:hypothetical protein GCM10010177_13250 [Actinomadura citrea]
MNSNQPKQPSKGFSVAGDRYLGQLSALRGVSRAIQEMPALDPEWSEKYRKAMNLFPADEAKIIKDKLKEISQGVEALTEFAKQKGEGENPEVEPIHFNLPSRSIGNFFKNLFTVPLFTGADHRNQITTGAFLMAATSSFEALLSAVAREIYRKNPSALQRSDHEFTLEELNTYATIEDAREALIFRRIESLLMESVDNWIKWIDRTTNIKLPNIVGDWMETREIFARRNIIVHAGGVASRRYISDLERAGIDTKGISVGQDIGVDPQYLDQALQRLIAFGLILVHSVWARLHKPLADTAAAWISDRQEGLIHQQMWTATLLTSRYIESLEANRHIVLDARVNGWLAHKKLDDTSVATHVRSWDVTGLARKYSIAKCLLLDDFDRCKEDIDAELKNQALTPYEMFMNPLFEGYISWTDDRGQSTSGED